MFQGKGMAPTTSFYVVSDSLRMRNYEKPGPEAALST